MFKTIFKKRGGVKMQVDYKELKKQRKEQILKGGKYCSAEITIC